MKNVLYSMVILYFVLLACACKQQLDAAPPYTGTSLKVNTSIRDLYTSHIPGNVERFINNEVITGIVTANDENDNFYKSIVIQDSTAAITVRLDGFGLSALFPLGMRVMIKLNGLWMGEYGGMLQIVGSVDRTNPLQADLMPLPAALFNRHIFAVGLQTMPSPIDIQYNQLHDSLQSRLIRLNQVEFAAADTAQPYSDAINKITTSHSVKFCSGGTIYLRTSGFANFAAQKTPSGNGSMVGIYSIFGSQKQLAIRDTRDVQFGNQRCIQTGPAVLLWEDFEQFTNNQKLSNAQWQNLAESGQVFFQIQSQQNNRFASISALGTGQPTTTSWLVLPPVSLSQVKSPQLSFLTKDQFDNGASLRVMISTNYDGKGQPWKAKWTNLKANIANGSSTGIAANWTPSGPINLNNYAGLVYIAFKYEGNDLNSSAAKKNTNFWVDDVKIIAQ